MKNSVHRCAPPGRKTKTPRSFTEAVVMGAVLVEWRWKRHVGDAGCSGYGDTHKRDG